MSVTEQINYKQLLAESASRSLTEDEFNELKSALKQLEQGSEPTRHLWMRKISAYLSSNNVEVEVKNTTRIGDAMEQEFLKAVPNPHALIVPFDQIEVTEQPRKKFLNIKELAEDIMKNGVLEPFKVRELPSGKYKLIGGGRRNKAIHYIKENHPKTYKNKFLSVPIILKLTDAVGSDIDKDDFIKQYKDNLQREDLLPTEDAAAIKRLMADNRWEQKKVAEEMGYSERYVSDRLSLLLLPQEIQDRIDLKELGATSAEVKNTLKNIRSGNTKQPVKNVDSSTEADKKMVVANTPAHLREIQISINKSTAIVLCSVIQKLATHFKLPEIDGAFDHKTPKKDLKAVIEQRADDLIKLIKDLK